MSKKYTFSILGGDRRQAVVAKKLLSLGHDVRIFGLKEFYSDVSGAEICLSAEKAISGCDAVLLPLPVSRDGETLNMFSSEKVDAPTIAEIIKFNAKNPNSHILGGIIPNQMHKLAKEHAQLIFDYYENEELQRKNAFPSAEGAIMIAMENMDKIIDGMPVLISGYGRVGKILADRLKKLGAIVSVAARRDNVLCEISMSGYKAVRTSDESEMKNSVNENEVIFNTVPEIIFNGNILSHTKQKPLYIEIASAPGGIDIARARSLGYRVLFAPSLPGKYAPVSAGEYIFETIHDILTERGLDI